MLAKKTSKSKDATVPGEGNWYLCADLDEEYTGFSPLAYSLDLLIPLVDLQQARDWAPLIPPPHQQWYRELTRFGIKHVTRLLTWVEIIFGWVGSLLLVAVLTGVTERGRK